jgi:hypothetical protein
MMHAEDLSFVPRRSTRWTAAGAFLGLAGLALAAGAAEPAPRSTVERTPAVVGSSPGSAALQDRPDGPYDGPYEGPYRVVPTRRRDAREGFIFSVGIGGAQNYLSGAGHATGFAFDFRMGYGFSDRFQLFFDFSALPAYYAFDQEVTSWTGTVRGQTVLFGDRQGNGLNLNLGVGLGGLDTYWAGAPFGTSRVGLALAGGLSVDFRVSPWLAISPEFTVQWHQVPNDPGFASDIHRAFGGQLNFVWYSPY